jgi:peptidoglycan/LPS O-acetylase OafA/YrhL
VAMNPKKIIGLENGLFDFLGRISFGIYVYHPLLIVIIGKMAGSYFGSLDISLRYIVVFAAVILSTILVAWLSYEYFEKKILRLKVKYSPVPSSADKQ